MGSDLPLGINSGWITGQSEVITFARSPLEHQLWRQDRCVDGCRFLPEVSGTFELFAQGKPLLLIGRADGEPVHFVG